MYDIGGSKNHHGVKQVSQQRPDVLQRQPPVAAPRNEVEQAAAERFKHEADVVTIRERPVDPDDVVRIVWVVLIVQQA